MNRRPRKLLIGVAAVLLLVAGWFWCTRPRIDERLLGTWQMDVYIGDAILDFIDIAAIRTITLKRDGTGFARDAEDVPVPIRWDSDDIGIGFYTPESALDSLRRRWDLLRGHFQPSGYVPHRVDRWRIREASSSRIELEHVKYPQWEMKLYSISE